MRFFTVETETVRPNLEPRRSSAGWHWHVRLRGPRHWSGVAELVRPLAHTTL
jgi:hypothetical protein